MEGRRKSLTDPRLRKFLVWFTVGATFGVIVPVSVSSLLQPRITIENTRVTYLDGCSFAVSFDFWKHDNDELAAVYQIFVNGVGMLSPPGVWYLEAKGLWPADHVVSAAPGCSAEAIVSVQILRTFSYDD